jgi:integrase
VAVRGRPKKPEGQDIEPPTSYRNSYRIRWTDTDGIRRAVTGPSEAEVRQRWLGARQQLPPGDKGPADRSEWQLIRGWLDYWHTTGVETWRGSTKRRHQTVLHAYVLADKQLWAGVRTADLDRHHLRQLLAQARRKDGKPLAPLSQKHLIAAISRAMTEAVALKLAPRNPCSRYKVGASVEPRPYPIVEPRDTLAFHEIAGLLNEETGKRQFALGDFFSFLLETGIRQGEGRALVFNAWTRLPNSGPFDLDNAEDPQRPYREMTIEASLSSCSPDYVPTGDETKIGKTTVRGKTKSGKVRGILLSDRAVQIVRQRWLEALRRWRERPHTGSVPALSDPIYGSPIFPSPTGGFLTARALTEALAEMREYEDRIAREYGWPISRRIVPTRVHAFRASAATRLLQLPGLSPSDIAYALGHQDGGKLLLATYGKPTPEGSAKLLLAENDYAKHGMATFKREALLHDLRSARSQAAAQFPRPAP